MRIYLQFKCYLITVIVWPLTKMISIDEKGLQFDSVFAVTMPIELFAITCYLISLSDVFDYAP